MSKVIKWDSPTLEWIHLNREKNYEAQKGLTPKEVIEQTAERAEKVWKAIEKMKKDAKLRPDSTTH
ncbi:MAG: hypothetical protein NTW14_09945 [bacterium]|nr:hypothetical protein [bacterium]